MIETLLGLVSEKAYANVRCESDSDCNINQNNGFVCKKKFCMSPEDAKALDNKSSKTELPVCNETQKDSNSCMCSAGQKQVKTSAGMYRCLSSDDNMGIDCPANKMVNGTCSMSVYSLLGIRQDTPNPNAGIFINDVVLSATFFIGTVVTLAIIYAGRELIWSSSTGDAGNIQDAQKKIMNALIGLALVSLSYTIIRLIQYLAAG